MILPILLLAYSLSCSAINIQDNEVDTRSIKTGDELLSAVYNDCFDTEKDVPAMSCLRLKVLAYLDSVIGEEEARSMEENDVKSLDSMILARVTRYLKTHQFKVQLPEFLFQEAVLTFRPGKSLTDFKIDFPKLQDGDAAVSQG